MTVATPARSPLQDRLAAARRANAGTRHAIARAATDDGTAPLSPAQARLWFLGQLEPGSCAYNAPTVLRLRGALDAAALLAALRDLAERHPVLRSVVGERDGKPVAVELPAAAVPLALLDVPAAGLPAALRAETERPFALDAEPPMRAAVLRLRDDEHVLVLTLHHIATDAWSHNLLLADLAALYAARLGLADAPGPPALRYGDYAAWLAAGHERRGGGGGLVGGPAGRPRAAARPAGRPTAAGGRGLVRRRGAADAAGAARRTPPRRRGRAAVHAVHGAARRLAGAARRGSAAPTTCRSRCPSRAGATPRRRASSAASSTR